MSASVKDDRDLLLAEFGTLRTEIENSVDRRFKVMTAGAAVVPVVQYFGNKYDLGFVSLGLPLLVLIISLLFIAENNAIMRAGRYIREVIEPRLFQGGAGWETWLERPHNFDARIVDKMVIIGFYLIEALYYVVGVTVGLQYAVSLDVRPSVVVALALGYGVLFVVICYLAIKQPRIGTMLLEERQVAASPTP